MKKISALMLIVVMMIGLCGTYSASAATKPGKPTFDSSVSDDASAIKLTININDNTSGYKIWVREPGSDSFTKAGYVKKSGKKARTFSYDIDETGDYFFKIRAYLKVDGKKVWGKTSSISRVVVAKGNLDVPVLIGVKEKPAESYVCGGPGVGESDTSLFVFEPIVDESIKDSILRLEPITESGTFDNDVPAYIENETLAFGVNRMGVINLVIYAYENDGDANTHTNPIARSEVFRIMSVGANENSGGADGATTEIVFDGDKAYFGYAPSTLVTDKALKSKIISAPEDHGVHTYEGERYSYDSHDDLGPFKIEPVRWRVINRTKKYALLITDEILNGGGYDGWRTDKTTTWPTSCLYYMLNDRNNYKEEEITYWPVLERVDENVLMEMEVGGTKCKFALPTLDVLTNTKYGFKSSTDADKARIIKPSDYYTKTTNNNAVVAGNKVFGYYWVINEEKGKTIVVDTTGKIHKGYFVPNVYEIGVVVMIKVDLTKCEVVEK